jgi:3D (Asp-Asp-Asp) domain-containing protein
VFIVEDRMNDRFGHRIDIWMEERADAQNFGLTWTTVEVF